MFWLPLFSRMILCWSPEANFLGKALGRGEELQLKGLILRSLFLVSFRFLHRGSVGTVLLAATGLLATIERQYVAKRRRTERAQPT